MSEIIPAILPKDFGDLEEKLGMVAGKVPMVHIDVTDGTLTPDSNWPYSDDVRDFLRITEEIEGFPYWEDVSFEAHLMVSKPEAIVEDWIKAGAERIIVHLEVFDDEHELSRFLSLLKNRFASGAAFLGVEIGLAVNMETAMEKLLPHVLEADFIHMMSIDKIGKQGATLDPKIFERIKALKEVYPETIISIDGGVNLENIESVREAGVERIIIGSAIFGKEDPEEALLDFLDINLE
jgi:ribulose-phosphate 3-epimerase